VEFLAAAAGKHRGNKSNTFNDAFLMVRRLLIAAAVLFAASFTASPSHAQAGPFAGLAGTWSGGGAVTLDDGSKERIRCRARYDVDGGGSSLGLMLRCASDSYNFELQSNATHRNGAVSGTWAENTRHVGGNIDGSARGNAINLRVSGVISATLGVSTNANQQSISIQAPGTELQSVAISLSRGAK